MSELPDNNSDEARRWLANVRDDLHALDARVPFRKIHDVVELHAICASVGRLAGLDLTALGDLNP